MSIIFYAFSLGDIIWQLGKLQTHVVHMLVYSIMGRWAQGNFVKDLH